MRHLTQTAARFFARLQQRFIRARSGSVLILVVALLVILALIGTAWMSAARNDRYGSTQNVANTQIDLLVEGAIAMVEGEIVDDLLGTVGTDQVYRPSGDPTATGYEHFDYPNDLGAGGDMWLADRVPVLDSGVPKWRHISYPLMTDAAGFAFFHDPRSVNPIPLTGLPPTGKGFVEPNSVSIEQPPGKGVFFPAVGNNIAADADGDGIADSLLFKLPIAPIDGVTYYMAYRVIDNSSAVNASIAWEPAGEPGTPPVEYVRGNFFPTNIDLHRLLGDDGAGNDPDTQMDALNEYRFDGNAPADVYTPNAPVADPKVPPAVPVPPTVRTDFAYHHAYEELWTQLGRRLNNPGYVTTADQYQSVPISDAMAMAYHFCLINPDASPSLSLETALDASIYSNVVNAPGNALAGLKAYAPGDVTNWWNDNFNYLNEDPLDPTTFLPRRALLVARNAVSNLIQPKSTSALPALTLPTGMDAYKEPPVKTSINTAGFDELWRAFWSVMVAGTDLSPFSNFAVAAGDSYLGSTFTAGVADATEHPHRMFRSSLRDPRATTFGVYFDPDQQLLLRSAIAAANTAELMDADNDITPEPIALTAWVDGSEIAVNVEVYGVENQGYISEVFAQTDPLALGGTGPTPNPNGYIAVELHNPHNEAVSIIGWRLAVVERLNGTGTYPALTVTEILGDLDTFMNPLAAKEIPAEGHLILENYQDELAAAATPDPTAATYRPGSQNLIVEETTDLGAADNTVFVPNLHLAFNRELVILRPRVKDAINQPLSEMIPLDQYDFTGLELPIAPSTVTQARAWHYVRANGGTSAWKCVYPGRYDANQTNVVAPALPNPRQQGTEVATAWTPTGLVLDSWDPASGSTDTPSPVVDMGNPDGTAGYAPTFAIQLSNSGHPGPHNPEPPSPPTVVNHFSYGQFARNGDILQVPFIGGYRVLNGLNLVEINSVTMDAAFAEDTDLDNDEEEQIGRFCPFYWEKPLGTIVTNDFGTVPADYRYAWARDLFDYLTVMAPHDDYFPNVDPAKYAAGSASPPPDAVANSGGVAGDLSDGLTTNDTVENGEPIHGLININTAPLPVLATLPFVPAGSDSNANSVEDNIEIANAIVLYRDEDDGSGVAHGPFTSIYDLQRVPGFINGMGWFDPDVLDADDVEGDISPLGIGGIGLDGVIDDFETKFLMLNRISNMITTRSDSFTAYIVVQGWRDAETVDAKLEVQRRVGVIIDRSGVVSTDTKGDLSTVRFPQN